MKTNTLLINLCFIAIFVLTPFFSIVSYGQDFFQKLWVLEQGEKKILVGHSTRAKNDLNNILGTWEDGLGNKIKFYLKKNPYFKSGKTPEYFVYNKIHSTFTVDDFTHILMADIDLGNISNGFMNIYPSGRGYDEIEDILSLKGIWIQILFPKKKGAPLIVESSNTWKLKSSQSHIKKGDEITWYPYINFMLVDRKDKTNLPGFCYITGLLYGTYGTYPVPFKKTSGDNGSQEEIEYAFKAAASHYDILPDGESKVEIIATLLEKAPGDNQSSKPISGKAIEFLIYELSGITPGSLSGTTAVTDAAGQAKIIFTAPNIELLQQSDMLIEYATVKVICEELNLEDEMNINFPIESGKIRVEPNNGVTSYQGVVPPDKRYSAKISAHIEDEDSKPLVNKEVSISILGDNPLGLLRDDTGKEAKQLSVKTDSEGNLGVQYFYAAADPPIKAVTEIVEVKSSNMIRPLKAEISIGFNIIFEMVENTKEGKGIINAGEEIPLRVKIKDCWNPSIDLAQIVNYWGGVNDKSGDVSLEVKLEIEKISTVPTYLLEQLTLENYPDEMFTQNMRIRSFKDKGVQNMLWMPEVSAKNYTGYPKIRPTTVGNHYYEARVTLIDQDGNEVFESKHPARKAYFNIHTGIDADAAKIFFISNPFKPQTREGKLLATALDLMGYGAILSVTDALFAINNGDVESLYSLLFSEVKGKMFEKVASNSAYNELAVDMYSGMALAEKVDQEIMKDQTGPIANMEGSIFKQLYTTFNLKPGQLIILRGNGDQKLFENKESDVAENNEIPVKENSYVSDEGIHTTSLKLGNRTIYIIPVGMKVRHENAIEMKIY